MRFRRVQLSAAADRIDAQHAFYAGALELPTRRTAAGLTITIGETQLEFAAAADDRDRDPDHDHDPDPDHDPNGDGNGDGDGDPFYHFALLVPGDRFRAAQDWIADRAPLLPHADRAEVVFDFPAWDAQALYFHDPAGNIVELIAHRGLEPSHAGGPFDPLELRGLSELGLVGRPTELAPPLTDELGLTVWDGRVVDHEGLAFVGDKARTLILVPTRRGWLPTGRPAERHPATIEILDSHEARVTLADGLYEITVASAARSD